MATIVVGTNSYVTEAQLDTYAADRGIIIEAADKSILLINAMDYIETRPYAGTKTDSEQALEFPRYPDTVVPDDIENAQMVAALLIDSGVDLFATVERAVKREKVDVLETEFMDNAAETPYYPQLENLLSKYYSSGAGGFEVIRG